MAGTFNKRENEKKRAQRRKEKEQRREERKANKKETSFEDMIAYVDENGNISDTPPDLTKKKVIKESDIDLTSKNMGGATKVGNHGMVKFFDTEKGYGFIVRDETNEEFFFHHSSADFPIAQQDRVSFDTERGPKGMNAVRIVKL